MEKSNFIRVKRDGEIVGRVFKWKDGSISAWGQPPSAEKYLGEFTSMIAAEEAVLERLSSG